MSTMRKRQSRREPALLRAVSDDEQDEGILTRRYAEWKRRQQEDEPTNKKEPEK